MTNPLDKFPHEERKQILDAGKSHPRYKALMAAYEADSQIQMEQISRAEERHYAMLDRLGVRC